MTEPLSSGKLPDIKYDIKYDTNTIVRMRAMTEQLKNRGIKNLKDQAFKLLNLNDDHDLKQLVIGHPWFWNLWYKFRDGFELNPNAVKGNCPTDATIAGQSLEYHLDVRSIHNYGDDSQCCMHSEIDALTWITFNVLRKLSAVTLAHPHTEEAALGVVKLLLWLRQPYRTTKKVPQTEALDDCIEKELGIPLYLPDEAAYKHVNVYNQVFVHRNGNFFNTNSDWKDPDPIEDENSPVASEKTAFNYDLFAGTKEEHQKQIDALVASAPEESKPTWEKCLKVSHQNINHIGELEASPSVVERSLHFGSYTELEDDCRKPQVNKKKLPAVPVLESQLAPSISSIERAQQRAAAEEIEELRKRTDELSDMSDPGIWNLTFKECCELINVNPEHEFKRPPLMNQPWYLLDHQVEAVAVIIKNIIPIKKISQNYDLKDPRRGFLLADGTGLGKSIEVFASILTLIHKRLELQKNYPHLLEDVEAQWPDKPHLVVCPADLVLDCVRNMKSWSSDVHVIQYDDRMKMDLKEAVSGPSNKKGPHQTIVVCSYPFLVARHGTGGKAQQKARKTSGENKNSSSVTKKIMSKPSLQGIFGGVWADEGHYLKGRGSTRTQTMLELRASFYVLITGTPIHNMSSDLEAQMDFLVDPYKAEAYIRKRWTGKHIPFSWDPWTVSVGEDEKWVYATRYGMASIRDKEKGPEQNEMIKNAMRPFTIRRSTTTVVNGKAIGEDIPHRVIRKNDLMGTPAHVAMKRKVILRIYPDYDSPEFRFAFDTERLRVFTHATFCTALENVQLMSKDIAKAWSIVQVCNPEDSLREYFRFLCENDRRFAAKEKPEFFEAASDEKLLSYVVDRSVKLQLLAYDLGVRVVLQRKKIIIWVFWPCIQLLVLAFLRSLGLKAAAFHAQLSQDARQRLVKKFNEEDDIMILVMNYNVASEGLNLHFKCHTAILLCRAASQPAEEQAQARICRLFQTMPQTIILYMEHGTADVNQMLWNMFKDAPQTGTWLDMDKIKAQSESGKVQKRSFESSDLEEDADEGIDDRDEYAEVLSAAAVLSRAQLAKVGVNEASRKQKAADAKKGQAEASNAM
ncbi:hypothetical protein BT63DRAFT_472436 [Microthyrium microscopicum]|uniref:Helicase ATP-binding domain-containing protein n=1 Tax=Microthyrium microscopicum TaxID=703497 RepID=A0A6A6UA37_9PEZI|nr:hypothetical protein BT63DRAFT_472436 [Microthyrium microscopicum]